VPSNVDRKVFKNRTNIQAMTRSGTERRKVCNLDKNGSKRSNRLCTLLASEEIH